MKKLTETQKSIIKWAFVLVLLGHWPAGQDRKRDPYTHAGCRPETGQKGFSRYHGLIKKPRRKSPGFFTVRIS